MRRFALLLCLALAPLPAAAGRGAEIAAEITGTQILPAFGALAETAEALSQAAEADCAAESAALRQAYGAAFDAWIRASHLRFGPTETGNRAFALAFWPDSRGKTPKALRALIAKEDPGAADPDKFAAYSIAARGFYALEYLLYDPQLSAAGSPQYRCLLTRAIARDIAATSDAIFTDWQQGYAAEIRAPGGRYRSEEEITQELFKALGTGLQVLADMRLGRPLGTFDRPRPNRAEARLSGRSLRHVRLSLDALEPLALALAGEDGELAGDLQAGFAQARSRAATLEDPALAGVSDPLKRIRIEALQQDVNDLRALVAVRLGPALGVEAGFNSLDGD
ncbi:imelysin family protein [Roseobacteraceae bacterium NS-SX3]